MALLATNAQAAKGGLDRRVAAALANLATKIPLAPELIGKASGILVFPQVYKAGFVFGGAVGDGALQVGGQTVQYYRTTAVSWGFQVGAQARTEVVLFMTQDALDTSAKATAGKPASMAASPSSISAPATASTPTTSRNPSSASSSTTKV